MRSYFRPVFGSLAGIAIIMILLLVFHVGGESLATIGTYSALVGAFIGGALILVSVRIPIRREENVEPWLKREQLTWILIGCGCISWGVGECFWRYYVARGESPWPSLADVSYSSSSPLVFAALILQPFSKSSNKRTFLILDSLITMGALLSIAWFLLLGSLAQTPAKSPLAKFLGLYYPTTDIALLSSTLFLLLRGPDRAYQAPSRRISLLVLGLGLGVYPTSRLLL